MKFILAIFALACAYYVLAEKCRHPTDCRATRCSIAVNASSHVECLIGDCSCVKNEQPCLDKAECGNATCIDIHGHTEHPHCYDGKCKCVEDL